MRDRKIRFLCPACKGPLAVPADRAGRSGTCPSCGAAINVPDAPSYGGDDLVEALSRDFSRVRDRLAVRIHPRSGPAERLVARELGPDLVQALVYNLPRMVVPVPRKHVEAWKRPLDELLRIGVDNLRKEPRLESRIQEGPGGIRLGLMADAKGQNPFTTSHVLFFEEYFGADAPHGVLVGLPQRRAILFHRIVDRGVIPNLELLLGTLRDMHAQGPDSLSPSLYWWKDGALTLLPSSIEGRELRVHPPPAFLRLVESLPGR